jgi:uncharacterized protein (DUF1697 family)
MPRYAALLRGINVGSTKRIAMADLRTLFAALGAENVQTYVQSGNVAFDSPSRSSAALAREIRDRIQADLGHDVAIIIRTHAELAKVAATRPFDGAPDEHLYVTFLAERPEAAQVGAFSAAGFEPDEFEVRGTEVYLHFPSGYGRSKLGNETFERKLGVAATTRNWRTVTAMRDLTAGKRDAAARDDG